MRELSPETAIQLARQLERLAPDRGRGPRDAAVEAAFLVAAVDGIVTPLELSQFADAVETLFGRDADAASFVQRFAEDLEREGWPRRVEKLGAALTGSEHAETAYRLAATVAFVDDRIAPAEAEALDALAKAFGVSDERTRTILGEVRTELFG